MNVADAIETRRAYRSLKRSEITEELIRDLARHAGLVPSCNRTSLGASSSLASMHPYLTESQAAGENERPARYPFEKFAFIDRYPPTPP